MDLEQKSKNSKSRQYPLRDTPELIKILLKDHTTKRNIIWASNSYSGMGKNFLPKASISKKYVTDIGEDLIKPRIKKHSTTQKERTKIKAEVFTPKWVVEKQNDLIEEEFKNLPLEEYMSKTWLEITCGEAPYMCSRYDSVSGKPLALNERIGFVDRKLQRLSREIEDHDKWYKLCKIAFQSSYGYEFQGDSLLIARENLLFTFVDYYKAKFKFLPNLDMMKQIAMIISYNVFQMDGLSYNIPLSEEVNIHRRGLQLSLFDEDEEDITEIEIIKEGTKVKIKDWKNNKITDFIALTQKETDYMKFDVVIGNPPYQENDNGKRDDGSANASASPLYHLFVESASNISGIQSLIIPARWISGAGKGLGSFTESMIRENNIKHFSYFVNSKDVFPNNDIKGGICYFVRDNNYEGKANINIHGDGQTKVSNRFFDENSVGVFIPYEELSNVLHKVKLKEDIENKNIQKIVSTLKPFGLRTDFFRNPDKYGFPAIQTERRKNNDIEIFGLENLSRTSRYVPSSYPIEVGTELINTYKVFLPYAYGCGAIGEAGPTPMLGTPMQICTETYLVIGNFETEIESVNLLKYIKTKFFRAMVGILKTTQHATRTFRLVPLQDFTSSSDIDWSQSIAEIDAQLYKKYGLTQDEIDFIETNIKEME